MPDTVAPGYVWYTLKPPAFDVSCSKLRASFLDSRLGVRVSFRSGDSLAIASTITKKLCQLLDPEVEIFPEHGSHSCLRRFVSSSHHGSRFGIFPPAQLTM